VANKSNNTPAERSRVRFVLVDFEGPSGDLQQLAQTFANAVKIPQPVVVNLPPQDPMRTIIGSAEAKGNGAPSLDATPAAEVAATPAQEEVENTSPSAKPQNGTKKKRYKTPSVIEDLDLTSGSKPFKEYMEEQAQPFEGVNLTAPPAGPRSAPSPHE